MYDAPHQVLNQIAPQIKNPALKPLFEATTEEDKRQALESIAEKAGSNQRAAMLFAKVFPLLQENVAISKFVERSGDPSHRMYLPEVTSLTQALKLAELESPMTYSERQILSQLLSEQLQH